MRTVKIEWDSDYDIDNMLEGLVSNARELSSMSIALAFNNRQPMCIRMFRQHEGWITDSGILRKALGQWINNGKGYMLVHFRGTHVRSNRIRNEVYPAKRERFGNDDTYVYYLGRYGSDELWNTVNGARSRGENVPLAVANFYATSNDVGLDVFEDYVRYSPEDDSEGEDLYRSYRIIGWHDGDITFDKYQVGTDGSWGYSKEALPNDCRISTWGYINED